MEENQGTYWDIDHVIPCSNFNLEQDEDIKKCFNWKNLRPCEKKENYKKNKEELIEEIKEKLELNIIMTQGLNLVGGGDFVASLVEILITWKKNYKL